MKQTIMKLLPKDILSARILIVDDQIANVQLLEELLASAGYNGVESTTDPLVVCAWHRKNHYDLILLDLQMPVMDGFQIMEALSTNESDSYLPVIVLTAQPGHKLRALQLGAKDFISKPFDLVEVKTRIYNMLEVRLLYKKLENYNTLLEETVAERTAELRESEARFRSLTELASDWYWEQDENDNFTKVSGPVLDMLGIRISTLNTKDTLNTEDVFNSSDTEVKTDAKTEADTEKSNNIFFDDAGWNQTERKLLQATIAAREPFLDFAFSRKNKDGSEQHFRVSGEPMFNQAAQFIGYRGIGIECKAMPHSPNPSEEKISTDKKNFNNNNIENINAAYK